MKSSLQKHSRLFGIAGALIALTIAIIYLNVVPKEASSVDGYQNIILNYGHALCWFLLSGASILWALTKNNKWSKNLAYAALVTYIIFISTLLITKF